MVNYTVIQFAWVPYIHPQQISLDWLPYKATSATVWLEICLHSSGLGPEKRHHLRQKFKESQTVGPSKAALQYLRIRQACFSTWKNFSRDYFVLSVLLWHKEWRGQFSPFGYRGFLPTSKNKNWLNKFFSEWWNNKIARNCIHHLTASNSPYQYFLFWKKSIKQHIPQRENIYKSHFH